MTLYKFRPNQTNDFKDTTIIFQLACGIIEKDIFRKQWSYHIVGAICPIWAKFGISNYFRVSWPLLRLDQTSKTIKSIPNRDICFNCHWSFSAASLCSYTCLTTISFVVGCTLTLEAARIVGAAATVETRRCLAFVDISLTLLTRESSV